MSPRKRRRRRTATREPDTAPGRRASPDTARTPGAESPPGAGDAPTDVDRKVEEIHHRYVSQRAAETQGLLQILSSKRRMMTVNFLAGLSRGVGFFLGATLVGGIALGALALSFDHAFSVVGLEDITLETTVRTLARKAQEVQALWKEAEEQAAREEARTGGEGDPSTPDTAAIEKASQAADAAAEAAAEAADAAAETARDAPQDAPQDEEEGGGDDNGQR